MYKVLLTTLNSKYIHASLAIRYLEKYCKKHLREDDFQIIVKEFSVNELLDQIMAEIFKEKADIVAFSCYIWNRDILFELVNNLKKVCPELIIVMGGPEVSFGSTDILKETPAIDIIIKGEGELTLIELLKRVKGRPYSFQGKIYPGNLNLADIKGLTYRDREGNIIENEDRELLLDLDSIPRPYTLEDLKVLEHKIIYYETSRGCPFNCSYCLSSTIKGVRSFSMERIKEDLLFFINNNVSLVKFVDRTFNYDKKRALEIFEFLVNNRGNTSFHFEISADILSEEILEFLAGVPAGLFQFEIGVQSTNVNTINQINRQMDFLHLAENVKILKKANNIKLHLDLIAGLPGEDYESFKNSFDDVYELNPHVLQLGFLKLLPGSAIRYHAGEYSYKYSSKPPYEVLENENISYAELLRLKDIEFLVDKYHNSGVFKSSLKYIFNSHYSSYFSFYEEFAAYFVAENLHRRAHSRKALYKIIYIFYKEHVTKDLHEIEIFKEILKYDLIKYNPGTKIPGWADKLNINDFNNIRYEFLDNRENIKKLLPHYEGKRVKDILKSVRFELFKYDLTDNSLLKGDYDRYIKGDRIDRPSIAVILFDYIDKEKPETYNVTDYFRYDL